MDANAPDKREAGLHHGLNKAQIVMIGLGGAIGTGLFMGGGIAIGYAGPAVLLSYAIAGFIALVMVFSLSEMAVVHPAAGSFGLYAETYLNGWAGFVVRYTYWMAQVLAIGGEAIAAGVYMTYWFPDFPVWIWSLCFSSAMLYINARSVNNFGTVEYWLSVTKVLAIVCFIVLGCARILGIGGGAVGLHNLTGLPGGFMPNGFGGVWMAVIVGIMSFNGIEVIAVTSGEAENPRESIPAALRTMILRLFLFYILALGIVVTFIPWTETGAKVITESPFVRILDSTGIRHAAGIMNFVIVTAALSSMNTNIYLSSRMLFSLSRGNFAPALLGRLNRNGAPVAAIVVSGIGILASSLVSMLTPYAYNYIFGVAMFGAILVWIIILLSHLGFRRRHRPEDLPVRMPLTPYPQFAALILLAAVLVTMGLDTELWDVSWICGVPWLLILTAAYAYWRKRPAEAAAALRT